MNIIVTGGSGYIGERVVSQLVAAGRYNVSTLDNCPPSNQEVKWIECDLKNRKDTVKALKNIGLVIHLASIGDAYGSSDYLGNNGLGTVNLIHSALKNKVKKIILASSCWVYGNSDGFVTENFPLLPPHNMYAYTKTLQEYLIRKSKVNYTILRYDSCYGGNMRSNTAIASFVNKINEGEPLSIIGDGKQGRCFVHVEDAAEATTKSINYEHKNSIFNIAGPDYITINGLVDKLRGILGDTQVEHIKDKIVNRGARINIEKAKRELDWHPRNFDKGIKDYLKTRSNYK